MRWLSRSEDEHGNSALEQLPAKECARQWGVPFSEVEAVKDIFEQYDLDKLGYLDVGRFTRALPAVLRAPRGLEVPESRITFFWKEIDRARTGKVSFEQFFWWYRQGGFGEPSEATSKPLATLRRLNTQISPGSSVKATSGSSVKATSG